MLAKKGSNFRKTHLETVRSNNYVPRQTQGVANQTSPITKTESGSSSAVNKQNANPPTKPNNNPYARPTLNRCYRCNEVGHRSHECPMRKPVHLADHEEEGIAHNGEEFSDNEVDEVANEDGEPVSFVVQRILYTPKVQDNSQRAKIFQSKMFN